MSIRLDRTRAFLVVEYGRRSPHLQVVRPAPLRALHLDLRLRNGPNARTEAGHPEVSAASPTGPRSVPADTTPARCTGGYTKKLIRRSPR